MESFTDRILGDYRILDEIGAGGMGRVFLAENIHHRKRCALKILPEELSRDVTFRARFFDEARVMSDLNHPGIVRVHHTGEDKGIYYLVMDYVSSPNGRSHSIHDELAQNPARRIAPAKVHFWITQVAQALAYAHHRGLIHRDIKPANILIDAEGNARVTDFGLAKAIGKDFLLSQIHKTLQQTSRTLRGDTTAGGLGLKLPGVLPDFEMVETTHRDVAGASPSRRSGSGDSGSGSGSYSLFGTYDYMSPELMEGKDATVQSDIYSLGVMMYRMLTGRRPVGLAKPPSTLVRGVSKKWDLITARCLADNAADRYPSVEAMLDDLEKIDRRSGRRLAVLVGLVLLAGVLALGVWTYRHPSTPAAGVKTPRSAGPGPTETVLPSAPEPIQEPSRPPVASTPVAPVTKEETVNQGPQNIANGAPPTEQANPAQTETTPQVRQTETVSAVKPPDPNLPTEAPTAVTPTPVPQTPKELSQTEIVRGRIEQNLEIIGKRPDEFLQRVVKSAPKESDSLTELEAWEKETTALAAFVREDNWAAPYDWSRFNEKEGKPFANMGTLTPNDLRAWRVALGGYPRDPNLIVVIPNPVGRKEVRLELRFVKAKGLWFQMGIPRGRINQTRDPSDPPQTIVSLASDFYLGKYEITQQQYQAVMHTNPSLFQGNAASDPNRPVERVSWDQARQFCTELSNRPDLRFLLPNGSEYPSINARVFRLPSEKEWEYACRAQAGKEENSPANWPEPLEFYNGNRRNESPATVCWYGDMTVSSRTHPIGKLKPNDLGLYDMHGNVWEWCQDAYDPALGGNPLGKGHVMRGGAYCSAQPQCRSGWRDGSDRARSDIGFRLVLEVK